MHNGEKVDYYKRDVIQVLCTWCACVGGGEGGEGRA